MPPEASKIKPYRREFDYSYVFGAFAVYEIIKAKPEVVRGVYIKPGYTDAEALEALCRANGIPFFYKERLNAGQNESVHVLAVFGKYADELNAARPHVVLVNPGDMGNIGTVARTMAAFNLLNLAIITPAADVFSPKCVRASMGALFRINFRNYSSFNEYEAVFPGHTFFPFMTGAKISLTYESCPETPLFSLVFGNEASGLPENFPHGGGSIKILQSPLVDSLNLSVAASVGMYIFALKNGLMPSS